MPVARIVLVTHPLRGAQAFARELVTRRLAACVQLVPLTALYRWRGRVERARELRLEIKTTAARLAALERHVRATHPYEVPEFVVLDPARVGASYLDWLRAETAETAERPAQARRRRRGGPA